MKRAIHVALAALMLLGVIAGAGATPVAASSCTDVDHDDDNNGVDNDGIDIDDNHGSIIIDQSDDDLLDLDLLSHA